MVFSIRLFAVLFFAFFSLSAQSRHATPIIDHIDVPVLTNSGQPLTNDQVRDAIISAAQMHNWQISRSPSQNLLAASLNVRGKHTISVTIPYSVEKFSIKYENSTNMKYGIQENPVAGGNPYQTNPTGNGVRVIHPNYNTWVQELLRAIQFELKKL